MKVSNYANNFSNLNDTRYSVIFQSCVKFMMINTHCCLQSCLFASMKQLQISLIKISCWWNVFDISKFHDTKCRIEITLDINEITVLVTEESDHHIKIKLGFILTNWFFKFQGQNFKYLHDSEIISMPKYIKRLIHINEAKRCIYLATWKYMIFE